MMLLSLVAFILLPEFARAQTANYVRYDDYSAADFDASPGTFVPTLSDCLALSNAVPLANGVAYYDSTKTCKLLTANNNEVLVNIRVNLGWVTYVKDISDQYRLVFKIDSEYTSSSTDALTGQLLTGASTAYTTVYNASVSSLVRSQSCGCAYRNPILDKWSESTASTVKLGFIKDKMVIMSANYNGIGQTSTSWFSNATLQSIAPFTTSNYRLQTNISCAFDYSSAYIYCYGPLPASCEDTFYFVATSSTQTGCSYEASPYPKLYVSPSNPASSANAAWAVKADFMLISAKFVNRVAVVP